MSDDSYPKQWHAGGERGSHPLLIGFVSPDHEIPQQKQIQCVHQQHRAENSCGDARASSNLIFIVLNGGTKIGEKLCRSGDEVERIADCDSLPGEERRDAYVRMGRATMSHNMSFNIDFFPVASDETRRTDQ